MTKNVGVPDRGFRTIVALILGILIVTGVISGTWAIILGIVAVVLLLTAFMAFCPIYLPFKISTLKKQE
jgi:hypothetical protein